MLHALIRDGNQVAVNDLLSSSQSSNLIFSANQDGETPLHVAAAVGGVDFIPLLLSKGASLEAQETQNGRTPLLVAAAGKQLKVVKKLIECNSHVAATDNDGNTILHLLVQQQQEEIQLFASILRDILARSKININHQNFSGEAPLHLAASAGNESAVLFLINQPSIDINLRTVDQATAVQLAARKGSKSLVNILLGMNCDSSGLDADEQQGLLPIEIVNMRQARTPRGTPTTTPIVLSSPLLSMQISSSSSSSLPIQAPAATISSSSSSSSSSSGYSLSAGLSLSSAKVRRASASLGVPNLGSSSKKLDPETVKRSIANLSSLLVQGTVSDIQKAIKKDKTLLKRRLDNGQTFLHFAIQTGRLDVIKIILDKTIKNINDIDENGNTALHLACMYHYYDIALFLIQQKASVSIANSKGHSALHLMSQKVTKDPANYEKVLKQLVSHGVNVNVPDAMGNAPVHFSAAMGDDSSLFFLHANGADLNTTNLNDHTPLIDAALNKRISTVKLLVSLGAIKTSLLQRIIDEKSTTPAIIEVLAPIELSKSSADNSSARYLVLKKPESSSLEVASLTVSPRSPSSSNSSSPRSAARLSLPISSMSMSSAFSPASPLPLATPSTSDKKSKKVGKGEAIKISSRVLNDDQKIDVTITMIQRGEDFTKYIKRDRFLVNKHSSKGYNLLHFACKAGKLDVVSQLIEKYKADVNIPTINGKSALLIALKEAHMEVVDLLIVRHADPTLISGSGRSAFHYLSQRPVKAQKYRIFPLLKYLADNGLSVNCLEKKTGNSALHIAAQKSDSAMVRMLLGLGANIDALNLQFQSPLLLATLSNNIENAKCLISRGGARALSLSVKNSGETLESAGIPPSLVDLINASSEKEHATIDTDPFISDLVEQYVPYQSLLGIDYSPRRVNSNEKSFEINKVHQIHSLVRQGIAAKLEIFKVLKKDTREVLYFLDDKGLNAIHICAIEGHTELLQAIIEKHHPSLDKKDHAPLGFTALHYAADKGHLKLVKLLVEKGANIKATSAKGETVLHILSELILDRDLVSLYNEIIGLIVHSGAAVDGPDAEGNTPLHRAASIGNPVGLAIFFDSEANVNARNLKNQTPLELACNQNQKTAARLLLSKGANIEWFFGAQPKNGNTSETDSSETEPETPVVPMSRSRSFSIASYDETKAASFGFSADIVALLKARLELLQTGGISSASPIPPQVSSSGSQSSVVPQIVIGHSQTPSVSVPIPAAGGLHSDGLLVDGMAVAGTTPRKDRFRIVPDNVVQFQTFVEEDNRVEIKKFLRKDKEGREMIQSSNRIGQTSVHLAAMHGHLELLETFVDKFKADSSSLDDQGHTALILAAQRGHLDCCIFLLESGAKMGMTRDGKNPVHYVSAMSSSDPVQYHRFFQLVSEKVPESLNGTTFNGDTPLHFAATYGNEQAALFITNSKTAQLDLYNNFGETPLQLAVRCGHAGIARILLRMGASTMGLEYDVSFITDLKEEIYTLLDPLEFQTPSLKALALTERPRDSSSLLFIDHRLTSLGELLDRRLTTRTTVSSTGSARALRSNSSKFLSGNKSAAESNDEGMSEDGRGTSNLSSIEEIAKSIIIRVVTTEPEEQECPSTSDIDEDATSPRPPPLAAGETPATLLAKFLDEQVSQLKGFPEGIVKSARHLYEAICTLHPMTTQLLFADVKHIVSFLDVFEVSLTDLYSFFLSNSNQRPASSSVITLSSYLLPFKKFMETIGLAHSLVKSDFPPESTVADLMEELTASTASSSKTKALSSTEGSLQRFVNLFGQLLGSTDIIEPLEGHSNDISSSFWSLLFDLVNTDVSSDSDLRNYLADPRFDKKQAHNLWTELAGSSTPINKKKFLELFNFEGAQSQMLATSCLAFNSATKAINELKQQYATQTPVDQFKSRLLLREVSRTVEALQTLLDDTQIGMNTEGGMKQGESTAPFVQMINNNITNPLDRTAELLKIEIKRLREAKQALLAPRNSNEILIPSGGSGLSSSSSSGSSSVSSSGSTIESVADSIVQKYKDSPTKILVSREVHAPGKDIDSLSSALTEYMAWSQVDPGCIHSRIEHSSEQSLKKRFVMFQVWDSPTLFASHLNSDHYRRYVSVSGPLKAFENVSITKVL